LFPPVRYNELTHSQEYVAKLKFRYVEQSAKEDFIKALSSAPEDADMASLASETAAAKSTLKEAKVQLDATFSKHRELAEQIAEEDTRVADEIEEAQALAKEIADMQLELARLRRDHPLADVSRQCFRFATMSHPFTSELLKPRPKIYSTNRLSNFEILTNNFKTYQPSIQKHATRSRLHLPQLTNFVPRRQLKHGKLRPVLRAGAEI
jgi:hypothetical protein